MEHMNTMKSSVLSAREFFQLTVNSLLELCTHCIDGHRIVSIEGRLLLTLDTGDKVALNIHQQNVSTSLNSVEDADVNNSSLVRYLPSFYRQKLAYYICQFCRKILCFEVFCLSGS